MFSLSLQQLHHALNEICHYVGDANIIVSIAWQQPESSWRAGNPVLLHYLAGCFSLTKSLSNNHATKNPSGILDSAATPFHHDSQMRDPAMKMARVTGRPLASLWLGFARGPEALIQIKLFRGYPGGPFT